MALGVLLVESGASMGRMNYKWVIVAVTYGIGFVLGRLPGLPKVLIPKAPLEPL